MYHISHGSSIQPYPNVISMIQPIEVIQMNMYTTVVRFIIHPAADMYFLFYVNAAQSSANILALNREYLLKLKRSGLESKRMLFCTWELNKPIDIKVF